MGYLYRTARRLKNSVPVLCWLWSKAKKTGTVPALADDGAYQARLATETPIYEDVEDINILLEIFHYQAKLLSIGILGRDRSSNRRRCKWT